MFIAIQRMVSDEQCCHEDIIEIEAAPRPPKYEPVQVDNNKEKELQI